MQVDLDSDKDGHPPKRGEPPQRSGAGVVLGIITDTLALLGNALASYWRWARSTQTWRDRALAYAPLLIVLYAVLAFSGLVKA
jgi:hypothetical protein